MKTLKKCIKAAKAEGRNWRKELQAILRNYRTTLHTTTGVAPAVLLLKRPVRNKLLQVSHVDPVSEIIRKYDSSQKSKIKGHADSKTYLKPCAISLGETVLVKRPFTVSKGTPVYDPNPMTVVGRKGNMITAENENCTITRNSSFFKSLNQPVINRDNNESQNNGFGSPVDKESTQESPAAPPCLNVPDTASSKSVSIPNVQADLPNSSNPVSDQAQVPHPDGQPPLRRSTWKRTPRKILDLQT